LIDCITACPAHQHVWIVSYVYLKTLWEALGSCPDRLLKRVWTSTA
jgi:hypothetical protein